MSAMLEAKTALRGLATEAADVVKNPRLNAAQKRTRLDQIEAKIKSHASTIEMHERSLSLLSGADSLTYSASLGGGVHRAKGIGAPTLTPSIDQLANMHDAVMGHKSFQLQLGLKAGVGDLVPDRLVPGVLDLKHEPTRILDHLNVTATDVPVVEYIRHLSTTGSAGVTAAGAIKPAAVLTMDKLEARARKIAVTTVVNDEDLADFGAFQGYILSELSRMVIDAENAEIIAGDGTGEHLLGLLAQVGILTRATATDTGLDAMEQAFADLRIGSSFCAPTLVVMHPTTFSKIRRSKDTQLRYLLNPDPTATEATSLWGVPTLLTTQITAGTGLALNTDLAAAVYLRQGLIIQTDYGTTGFEKNQTVLRCEERLALAVPRPSAVIKVTGL